MTPDAAAAAKAVRMLDLLAAYFDDNQHWVKDKFHDGKGGRCLVSAMCSIRARHQIYGDATRYYLMKEIHWWPWKKGLMYFNDRCETSDLLRHIIRAARRLASADTEEQQPVSLAA